MEIKGTYSVSEVLDWMEVETISEAAFKEFAGVQALSSLLTYKVFKEKGIKCLCDIEGSFFRLERTPGHRKGSIYNNWHFNLYGKDTRGRNVMLTKDHSVPKSEGGTDDLSNLEPMCSKCNGAKGSRTLQEFKELVERSRNKWDTSNYDHISMRLKERYNIDISEDEYIGFLQANSDGEQCHKLSSSKSYRKLTWNGQTVFTVYSSQYHQIYSVLDPKTFDDRLRTELPQFTKGREGKAKSLYDHIYNESMRDANIMKDTKFESPRDMYVHSESFKYKRISLFLFKGLKYKANLVIWKEISNKFKRLDAKKNTKHKQKNTNSQ